MATATTYELGVSGSAFTGAANREDLLDIITIISPVDTPMFTMLRKTKIQNVQVEWLTDLLDTAATNAVADGSSATFQTVTPRVRLSNYAQISRESYDVSDSQRAVNPAGIRDEMRYQMGKAIKQWKRDCEFDIINGSAATGTPASTRCARGIYFWLAGFSGNTAIATGGNTALNLQEDDLNARLQTVWVSGGLCDYVIATATQKSHISNNFAGSANSRRNMPMTDNTVVNVVDYYMSDFGNVKILPHRWFKTATTNVQRTTLMIQSDKWLLGFLRPPRNVPLAKIGSSERAMVEGEWSLINLHPSANTFLSGHAAGTFGTNFPLN
jgi:hypothetical protein